ncbi:ligand-effect modulator 3 family [Podospora aff. communis PSN243]|uniref:Ligand-effect modulator 3 family n=1 Tax=Podospora aff. communis PSN243 TaxID=3040156 RepID=A0AAV9GXD1_9PEZI|nr:ligand-effect modulator 3 family [Podospora aff. communis PSN243]
MAPRRRRGADAQEDNSEADAPKNRPPNTAFRQQRMKAWQCVLTPKLIVTIFSILAAIYLGFGAYLTWLAHTVRDLRIDYTDCVRDAPKTELGPLPPKYISAHFSDNLPLDPYQAQWQVIKQNVTYHNYSRERDICQVEFNIPERLEPSVSFYYYLENFYQNHRRYVASFNAKQLLGEAVDGHTINESTCQPIAHDINGKIVYPCGIIANSMFNDTFSSPTLLSVPNPDGVPETERVYAMENNTGIAWPGLSDLYGKTSYRLDQIVPPPNWHEAYLYGYTNESPPPDLHTWEAFQNWMMLAASPNFYKLYQRNDREPMLAGTYQINITSNFDTNLYNGRKSFVITTVSTMGSRNIWPGIIFLIVGGVCLILDVYFILSFFLWKPRKLGDPSYLSWNQPQAPAPGHAASAP